MKLGSVTTVTLFLTFVSAGALHSLRAQDASSPSSDDVYQCMKWIKATVPNLRTPNDGRLTQARPRPLLCGHPRGNVRRLGRGLQMRPIGGTAAKILRVVWGS